MFENKESYMIGVLQNIRWVQRQSFGYMQCWSTFACESLQRSNRSSGEMGDAIVLVLQRVQDL